MVDIVKAPRELTMAKWMQSRSLTTFTRVVMLTAVYFLGGLVGKKASFLSGSMALVWPPTGIALAAILLFGYRFWPGVALGAVLFSFMNGVPLGFFTLGNGDRQHDGRHRLRVPAQKNSSPSTMRWSAPGM